MRGKRLGTTCFLVSALVLLAAGCGGGPGAPGGSGSGDTGLEVDLAAVAPLYLGANTSSVDAFLDICDPGPPVVLEDFATHQATLTFTARLLNPSTSISPPTIFVTQCSVQFARANDSI